MKNTRKKSDSGFAFLERKILELDRTVHLLEEARSHYADHYDFAPFGCITLDDRGCILELNVTAAKWLGRARAMLVGLPLLPFVRQPHVGTFLHHLRECHGSPDKHVCEIALGSNGDQPRMVELLTVPVIDTGSGRTVQRTVLRDVTESHRIQSALRQSEERFATTFRASPSAIVIATVDEGRILDVNASMCRMLGLSRADVVGKTTLELGFHPDAATREKRIAALLKSGTPRNIETQIRTKSGELRDALVSVELIQLEGRPCVLAIGQDVTEQKRLQREILEISEREQSRIGQDLHDGTCQTLTGIAIHAEVIARELDCGKSQVAIKVRDLARSVRQAADEMRQLAAGLCPMKIQRDGLEWALRDLATETAGRCEVNCEFHMPVPVAITDESAAIHLYRIAQEAVNNAIRHGRAQNIGIELLRDATGFVSLRIRDDGIGLPPKGKRKRGLGLHSMEYRARMLGGSLQTEPIGKRGTEIVCLFSERELEHVR